MHIGTDTLTPDMKSLLKQIVTLLLPEEVSLCDDKAEKYNCLEISEYIHLVTQQSG